MNTFSRNKIFVLNEIFQQNNLKFAISSNVKKTHAVLFLHFQAHATILFLYEWMPRTLVRELGKLHKMKSEKTSTWIFLHIKNSNFWSICLASYSKQTFYVIRLFLLVIIKSFLHIQYLFIPLCFLALVKPKLWKMIL